MIAILEWTQSNVQQNIEQLQTPTFLNTFGYLLWKFGHNWKLTGDLS